MTKPGALKAPHNYYELTKRWRNRYIYLSSRACGALAFLGCVDKWDIADRFDDLISVPNCGVKTRAEIKEEFGRYLRPSLPPPDPNRPPDDVLYPVGIVFEEVPMTRAMPNPLIVSDGGTNLRPGYAHQFIALADIREIVVGSPDPARASALLPTIEAVMANCDGSPIYVLELGIGTPCEGVNRLIVFLGSDPTWMAPGVIVPVAWDQAAATQS